MLQDNEQLLQFNWNLNDRREDDNERAVMFATGDLPAERLHNLGALQEPVKVLEHEDGRPAFTCESVDGANGGERILSTRSIRCLLTNNGKPRFDVPDCQRPRRILSVTELGNLGERVFVLVALDPESREAGLDVLAQRL